MKVALALLRAVAATALLLASTLRSAVTAQRAPEAPHASFVVLIILENRDYGRIIGSPDAPYINGRLVQEAALMTNAHAIAHPSQPNYLAIFSGATQGVKDDSCPHSLRGANVGAALLSAGKSFAGYSESMPIDGYTGCFADRYARKHNPWVNFTNVPSTSNLIFKRFPQPPPTLTIIIPNLCDDMHDCDTATGDLWLSKNLPPILRYDRTHNGLFVLTWDEADPDAGGTNRVATMLIGPMVKPGKYGEYTDHYSILHTVEAIAGIPCTGKACRSPALTTIWR
jgi:phosphatidylinositol-3-phosphatase